MDLLDRDVKKLWRSLQITWSDFGELYKLDKPFNKIYFDLVNIEHIINAGIPP